MTGAKGKSGGQRDGAGRPRQSTIAKNGLIAVPLDRAALVISRNGHRFEPLEDSSGVYYMVDGDRIENYFEAAHEFQARANPKRYRRTQ